MEVVHYPRLHEVAKREPRRALRMVTTGWSHQASDGDTQMWVRDRIARA